MDIDNNEVPFSPILILEFIRQTTVARFLNSETLDITVKFKIAKTYYEEVMSYPLKAQLIRLYFNYNEDSEILEVKTDEVLLNRFREQKSMVEIANKYENQYKERYRKYIEVVD